MTNAQRRRQARAQAKAERMGMIAAQRTVREKLRNPAFRFATAVGGPAPQRTQREVKP